jgi:hypothetical protein
MAAAIFVAACGGRAPTSADPPSAFPLHLTTGTYTLTLDIAGGAGATGGVVLLCSGAVSVTRATVPVKLERADPDLTVQPQMTGASLRLRLQVSGDDRLISGTMFGHAIADQGVSVDVFGDTSTDAALVSGRVDAASVQGMIIGQVLFDGAGCTTSGHNWTLTPRQSVRSQ